MIVAGRAPDLNSCILRTISSRGLPARDSMSPTLTPPVPWQLAQVAAMLRADFGSPACAIATVAPSAATATDRATTRIRTNASLAGALRERRTSPHSDRGALGRHAATAPH